MNIIEQIRKIVGTSEIDNYNMNTETNIIKEIQKGKMEDSKIMVFIKSFISKGKTTESELIGLAEKIVKRSNRTKYTFKTLEEVAEFSKNNNCGEWWFTYATDTEKEFYSIYKY